MPFKCYIKAFLLLIFCSCAYCLQPNNIRIKKPMSSIMVCSYIYFKSKDVKAKKFLDKIATDGTFSIGIIIFNILFIYWPVSISVVYSVQIILLHSTQERNKIVWYKRYHGHLLRIQSLEERMIWRHLTNHNHQYNLVILYNEQSFSMICW